MSGRASAAPDRSEALIDLIYDAAAEAASWDAVLIAIAEAAGCASSVFIGHCEGDFNAPRFAHFGRFDPALNIRGTSEACPYLPRLARMKPGDMVSAEDMAPLAERRRTAWHNEILEPQDAAHNLMSVLTRGGGTFGVFFLARGEAAGDFTPRDRAGLQRLLPHLRRAAAIRCRLDGYGLLAGQSAELLDTMNTGIVLIDESGRARPANRAAEDMLARSRCLTLAGAKLTVRDHAANLRLEALIAETKSGGAGGALAFPGSGELPCLIRVAPLRGAIKENAMFTGKARPAVAVFLTSTKPQAQGLDGALVDFYRLTPGEARVTEMLARGHGIPGAADVLALSENTVKMHAKRAYEKLGVSSQAQLAELYARLVPPMRAAA